MNTGTGVPVITGTWGSLTAEPGFRQSQKGPETRSPAWRRDREEQKEVTLCVVAWMIARECPHPGRGISVQPCWMSNPRYGIIDNMADQPSPITEALRRAIVEKGTPYLKIEQATGVTRGSISRFVS